jgi:hypothetical protein
VHSILAFVAVECALYSFAKARESKAVHPTHLKFVDVAVHAPSRGRAEGARGVTLGGLGWARVVDDVVHQVLRQACM